MDAERSDEQVNLLGNPGAGVLLPMFGAPIGESVLVPYPKVLHGQREFGRPQVHLVKALGPSNGEVRLRALRAIAQVMGRVGAPTPFSQPVVKVRGEQEVLLPGVDRRALEFVIFVPPLRAA